MFCVACMILANCFAVTFAMALCFMAGSKNMQESIRTCVLLKRFDFSNMDCICFV